MKVRKPQKAKLNPKDLVPQKRDPVSKETMEQFVKDYYALECRCFMCRGIAGKIEKGQPLTEADQYHMSVCLPALWALKNKDKNEKGWKKPHENR